MRDIELAAVPNQRFSLTLEGDRYDITLQAFFNGVAATIDRNGVRLISGTRAQPDWPLLPFEYLEYEHGNFIFTADNDDLIDYTKFGVTQFLSYVSIAEIAAWR